METYANLFWMQSTIKRKYKYLEVHRMKNDPIRYYRDGKTFFLRGKCKLYSTKDKYVKEEDTIFIHSGGVETAPKGTGLLTKSPIQCLCIFKAQASTLFIISSKTDAHILFHSAKPLSNADMCDIANLISDTLVSDLHYPKQHSMDIIISYSLSDNNEAAIVSLTFIKEIVIHGVIRAEQHTQNRPSFQIFIPSEGESKKEVPKGKWHEWIPEGCSYYPCHHIANQICDYCYCPFYPCYDKELGACITSSKGEKVWSCETCALLHHPTVAMHLRAHPTASLTELKAIHK
jgi:Zn-finger protein